MSRIHQLEFLSEAPEILYEGGFLKLQRRQVRNIYEDGQTSPWYAVEAVTSPFPDAVVLVLYAVLPSSPLPYILLRRTIRPVIALRREMTDLDSEHPSGSGVCWELPAGGVESGDLLHPDKAITQRAVSEAWEEAGARLSPQDFVRLGPAVFNASAFSPERLHFLAAPLNPKTIQPPPGDGHPMEEGTWVELIPLAQGQQWCKEGRILDLKTEVGLQRFADWWTEHNTFCGPQK